MKILKLFFIIYFIFSFNLLEANNEDTKSKITKNLRCLVCQGQSVYVVKKSVACSYLDEEILKTNEKFQVEINGNFYNCSIIKEPLYDPRGTKMRS